jgi:2-polyprenyl-6-methoxyphenol hydroxylase-like FAD-dependent oxidoreductase
MALHRAGIEAAVYEAHIQSAKDVGSYLTVATNGLVALRAIDAYHAVRSAGFSTPAIVLSNDAGMPLGRIPTGTALADGTVSITIRRARLHRVLVEQAKGSAVPFEFGKRLTAVETAPSGGVVAHFQDGTQATGDLLVGCDGVHSTTRRIIDPAAPAGRYVGLINFGGYTRYLVWRRTRRLAHGFRKACILRIRNRSPRRNRLVRQCSSRRS